MGKKIPNLLLDNSRITGRNSPWDLSYILYESGTSLFPAKFAATVDRSGLGKIMWERVPLAVAIFQQFQDRLAAGYDIAGCRSILKGVWAFYHWANTAKRSATLATLRNDYLDWSDDILRQYKVGKMSLIYVIDQATVVGRIFGKILGSHRNLIRETRLPAKPPPRSKTDEGLYENNLSNAIQMGALLYDLSSALGEDAIRGPLPLKIALRDGRVIEEWCGFTPDERLTGQMPKYYVAALQERRRSLQAGEDCTRRVSLINLRIEVEFLIFLGCTDMNVTQARALKIGDFSYSSFFDGYEVRRLYKERRKGEVEFRIHKEYRDIFERYLEWRKIFCPNDDRLFPRIGKAGQLEPMVIQFQAIRVRCKRLGIPFVSPKLLRGTATNWHLRRTKDPEIVAEIAQHSKDTLGRVYEIPDRKLAAAEISKFHTLTDPALAAAGPGQCQSKNAAPLNGTPPEAPQPDCISPAGCLFCMQNRDIDSFDHVWSLSSFRYLKSLELSKSRPPKGKQSIHPAQLILSRASAKLDAIRAIDTAHAQWIEEASNRIEEGWYHPAWEGFIRLAEVCK
jgi:hypothetical protein